MIRAMGMALALAACATTEAPTVVPAISRRRRRPFSPRWSLSWTAREIQMAIKNIQELEDLLAAEGIDLGLWGKGEAKNIRDLWTEVQQGEAIIQTLPLRRRINVVAVYIRRNSCILIEGSQDLADGRTRVRDSPPSEKMKPGEDYKDAAIRCLEEELQVKSSDIELFDTTHEVSRIEQISPSYPGLPTIYIKHTIDVRVKGLPANDFSTSESSSNREDAVRRHHWRWVDDRLKGYSR